VRSSSSESSSWAATDKPSIALETGEKLTVRCRYRVFRARPANRCFSVLIYTSDGHVVTAPNTKEAGIEIDVLDGRGYVDLQVDSLMLLPGLFDVSVAITDGTLLHHYDNRQSA